MAGCSIYLVLEVVPVSLTVLGAAMLTHLVEHHIQSPQWSTCRLKPHEADQNHNSTPNCGCLGSSSFLDFYFFLPLIFFFPALFKSGGHTWDEQAPHSRAHVLGNLLLLHVRAARRPVAISPDEQIARNLFTRLCSKCNTPLGVLLDL